MTRYLLASSPTLFALSLALLCPLCGHTAPARSTPQARTRSRTARKVTARKTATHKSEVTPQRLKGKTLFVQGDRLWAQNADGTGRFKVLPTVFADVLSLSQVALSPDRTHIAFATNKYGGQWYDNQELFVVRVDGTDLRHLTTRDYRYFLSDLQFSPNGKRILYGRTTGSHSGGPMNRYADVWIVNADGSGQHCVTDGMSQLDINKMAACIEPTWSRDGQRIFYRFIKGGIFEAAETPPTGELWSVKLDGTDAKPEPAPAASGSPPTSEE